MCREPIPNKSDQRKVAMTARDAIDPAFRVWGSTALADFAPRMDVQGRRVALYHAIGSEIDAAGLAKALAQTGALLALPVLRDATVLVFRAWGIDDPLVPAGFGTLGPSADRPDVVPDLVILPLVGFSSRGQRLGYGKGHYDRALAALGRGGHWPVRIGLAFDEQEVEPFAHEPHDIPLDAVLTPRGLRVFDQARIAPVVFVDHGL